MNQNRCDSSGPRSISRRRLLQGAGAIGAAAGAAWLFGAGEAGPQGQVLAANANPGGGAFNVLYLHTGSLAEEAAEAQGSWSWWDDYDRATLTDYLQNYNDATCHGGGYLFMAVHTPLGTVWRVRDSDLSVTKLAIAGRGTGADMCYDPDRNCVWVLWGNDGGGVNGISMIDVATWTETAFTAPLSPVTSYGAHPSIALSKDGAYLYVACVDHPEIQRIAIGAGPSYALTHETVVTFPPGVDSFYFHIIRVDPADGHIYAGTSTSAFMVRLDTSMNIVWTYAGTPAWRDGTYVPFGGSSQHDDIVFDATYFYVPATTGPSGVHRYRKSNGEYVSTFFPDAASTTWFSTGVEIDSATGDIYMPDAGLRGVVKVPAATPAKPVYRQSDNQSGEVDDLDWNGSQLWTVDIPQTPMRTAYVDLIRYNKFDGPAGAGRIRCTPSPPTPHCLRAGTQGAGNGGVYAGGQFWVEGLAFNSSHWTCITLSADATTAGWFARVAVIRQTGIIALMLSDGTTVHGSTIASGWSSIELRYDAASRRYRVYAGPGQPCIDVRSTTTQACGSVIYGPWDPDQSETLRWGVHTIFDVGLDVLASQHADARFGPVTAIRSTAPGRTGNNEWTATGEPNAALCIVDDPDLLMGATREIASSYISASGSSDSWQEVTAHYVASPLNYATRHIRWGVRARRTGTTGSLALGYGGNTARFKGDAWTLGPAIALTDASTWYDLRAAAAPGGGALPTNHHNLAMVFVGNSGGDAQVTQGFISHLWQLEAVDWGERSVGGVARPPDVAAPPATAAHPDVPAKPTSLVATAAAAIAGLGSWWLVRKHGTRGRQ